MFLTKWKLATVAVLCACLIGGSFTSSGIAQDAKLKPAVGRPLDIDGDAFPDILVTGQLPLVNQKSKSQPKSNVRTVDLGRILDLLDGDTDLDGDAYPDILLDLGGGTQILLTNYRSHLRGGKSVKPGGGNKNKPDSAKPGAPNDNPLPGAEGSNKQPKSGNPGATERGKEGQPSTQRFKDEGAGAARLFKDEGAGAARLFKDEGAEAAPTKAKPIKSESTSRR